MTYVIKYVLQIKHLTSAGCQPIDKTEDLNIYVFNIIIGKNESKILTKDMQMYM